MRHHPANPVAAGEALHKGDIVVLDDDGRLYPADSRRHNVGLMAKLGRLWIVARSYRAGCMVDPGDLVYSGTVAGLPGAKARSPRP